MESKGHSAGTYDLSRHGLEGVSTVYWNLTPSELIEQSLTRNESRLAANGSLVAETGQYTGRSPLDRYVVLDETTEATVGLGQGQSADFSGTF